MGRSVGHRLPGRDLVIWLGMATDPRVELTGYGDQHLIQLTLDISTEPLTATVSHPIWIDGRGWTEASNIGIGDRVLLPDGSTARVRDARDLGQRANTAVYNLTVDGPHTFSVLSGETPIVVHNASCAPKAGVYVLTLANGKKYVGRSKDLDKRVASHTRKVQRNGGARRLARNRPQVWPQDNRQADALP